MRHTAIRITLECGRRGWDRRPIEAQLAVRFPRLCRYVVGRMMALPNGRLRRWLLRSAGCAWASAFNRRDWATLPVLFHPEAEARTSFPQGMPLGLDLKEVYRGPDEWRAGIEAWLHAWDEFRVECAEVVDLGDRVLFLSVWSGRGAVSGMEIRQEEAQLYVIAPNGWLTSMQQYWGWNDALEAVGLRE